MRAFDVPIRPACWSDEPNTPGVSSGDVDGPGKPDQPITPVPPPKPKTPMSSAPPNTPGALVDQPMTPFPSFDQPRTPGCVFAAPRTPARRSLGADPPSA